MRVILDVDGVLANFVGRSLDTIDKLIGKRYAHDDVTRWEIEQLLPEYARPDFFKAVESERWCASIPPYPGACDTVRVLRSCGVDVVIATSPWKTSRHWQRERTEWCRSFLWSGIEIHHTHDKSGIRGDIFVDDKPSHVLAWQAANPEGIARLWDQPYNQGTYDAKRLHGWLDLIALVHLEQTVRRRRG